MSQSFGAGEIAQAELRVADVTLALCPRFQAEKQQGVRARGTPVRAGFTNTAPALSSDHALQDVLWTSHCETAQSLQHLTASSAFKHTDVLSSQQVRDLLIVDFQEGSCQQELSSIAVADGGEHLFDGARNDTIWPLHRVRLPSSCLAVCQHRAVETIAERTNHIQAAGLKHAGIVYIWPKCVVKSPDVTRADLRNCPALHIDVPCRFLAKFIAHCRPQARCHRNAARLRLHDEQPGLAFAS
mmetsp:Transcript_87631/g.165208  ORF Transcript_87631/g.165208 Transcript_87631/m.165208 type:complete len:242 (-) Transcript_87631:18-743(-)